MIKASVQDTIFSDTIRSMQVGNKPFTAPQGLFYQLSKDIVPYSTRPTILKIETDRVNEPVEISIVKKDPSPVGIDPRLNKRVVTVVPQSEVATVGIQLHRGLNKITARVLNREEEITYLYVRATSIVSTWEAFARVLFTVSTRITQEQRNAVSSSLATRLMEPFVSFQDLIPDLQSLQIISLRLLSRGLIHAIGSDIGALDTTKALTLTTPVLKRMDKDTDELYPSLDPWTKAPSQFSGKEAHVWLPNVGIISWVAFLHYIANQPDLFEIVSISEDEVVVRFQGELQRHRFDFDSFGTEFLTAQAREECFKSILINVFIDTNLPITICAPAYTFDLFVTEDNPIGNCRISFDKGIPLDTGCSFDSDEVDPFSDGWVGLSLTGRFEQDFPATHPLDTFVMPSTTYPGPVCGYEGHYTQLVYNQRYDIDLPIPITVEGFYQPAIFWTLESPDSTRWDVTPNDNGELVAVSGSTRPLSNFKVTKPDASEAAFDITNAGELQVVSPPPGGEDLRDDMYIKSPDGCVWNVNVNNSNELETQKIFPIGLC